MATLAAAITKSLLAKLPSEAATRFELDEGEFKEFLQSFLNEQMATGKSKRARGPKGTNGKGRVTGYVLFSTSHRDGVKQDNPDLKFAQISKELGKMWKALSDKEREDWNARASKENQDNGLASATPAPSTSKPTVVRHDESKTWVMEGTRFVVVSKKNPTVVGKLNSKNKVVALNAGEKKKCTEQGWQLQSTKKRSDASDDDDSE